MNIRGFNILTWDQAFSDVMIIALYRITAYFYRKCVYDPCFTMVPIGDFVSRIEISAPEFLERPFKSRTHRIISLSIVVVPVIALRSPLMVAHTQHVPPEPR